MKLEQQDLLTHHQINPPFPSGLARTMQYIAVLNHTSQNHLTYFTEIKISLEGVAELRWQWAGVGTA